MKSLIISLSLCFAFSMSASAGERFWFEDHYKSSKLEREYRNIEKKIDTTKFKEIFSKDRLYCETNVFVDLSELKPSDIKYALFLANKKNLIDEVELDILLTLSRSLEKINTQEPAKNIEVRRGQETIRKSYHEMLSSSECLKDSWQSFYDKMTSQINISKMTDTEIITSLNYQALQKKTIARKDFMLFEMLNQVIPLKLSIKEYHSMRARLESQGVELNQDFSAFKRSKEQKESTGLRYQLYSNYTLLQMKEMLALLERFSKRSSSESSSIIFLDENADIQEAIELGPTEQLRLSMKLFSREKKELILKSYFGGKSFSYRDLIALAYETKKVDEQDLAFLKLLESETEKRSLLQVAASTATRYSFVATLLVGPSAGFVYALGVTIANNYLNRDDNLVAQYDHDIFFGNCQANLR